MAECNIQQGLINMCACLDVEAACSNDAAGAMRLKSAFAYDGAILESSSGANTAGTVMFNVPL